MNAVRRLSAIAWWAVYVELSVRRAPLSRTCERLGIELASAGPSATPRPAPRPCLSTHDVATLEDVRRFYRWWPGAGHCLRSCLVAGHLLRYRDPVLVIGVRRADEELLAHAWLEVGGVSVDPESGSYLRLLPSPADGESDRSSA
jgi:hypothetical protein